MNLRQQLAYDNPLFSMFQLAGSNLWREETPLPTGIRLQTWFTVNAYEDPYCWHAAVGFVRPVVGQEFEAIPYDQWDYAMNMLAAATARDLLKGVGRTDGGGHWDTCKYYAFCIQANRRMTEDEAAPIRARRVVEAHSVKIYPSRVEDKYRSLWLPTNGRPN